MKRRDAEEKTQTKKRTGLKTRHYKEATGKQKQDAALKGRLYANIKQRKKEGGLPCGSASLGWLGTGRIKSPAATRKGKKQIPHDFTRDDNVGGGGMTVWGVREGR